MKKNSKNSTSKKPKVYDRRKPITDWPQYANAFPYRLEYVYNNDKIIAYFECTQHLDKYLLRYHLNNKNSRVDVYNNTYTPPKNYNKPKRQLFSTINDFFT
jgi:hypothetical protein